MTEHRQAPLPSRHDRPGLIRAGFPSLSNESPTSDSAELKALGSGIPKPLIVVQSEALEEKRPTSQAHEPQAHEGPSALAKESSDRALPRPVLMAPEDGTSPSAPPLSDPILTVKELADFLRLDHKTVREAIERGEIPGVRRIGATIRIYRDAVIKWLSSGQGRVSRSRRIR